MVGTLDRHDQLIALVNSVRQTVTMPWELHVSDAGSSDGTRDWLRREAKEDARIRPVFETERTGQAAALNAVFSRLSTAFACWLSDDNVLVSNGIDVAVAALAADRHLGMVGLKVRDMRGPFVSAPYIGGVTSIGIININQGVLPTALLHELCGFDTEFRDYGIDADLTTRVLLAGYDVALTRQVAIEHFRNWPDAGTAEAAKHEDRNAAYRARYDARYGDQFGFDPGWITRRAAWKMLRIAAPWALDPESGRTLLGRPVRDWHNLLAGRFVKPYREFAGADMSVYLRQVSPRRRP